MSSSETKRGVFRNGEPRPISAAAPAEAAKVEFGRRLQARITAMGVNQSEFARRVAVHTAEGTFGRDNVSNYIRGKVLPGPPHLAAMARALDCQMEDLLPTRGLPKADDRVTAFEIKADGEGTAWLRVNQSVPIAVALEIAKLLNTKE